MAIHEPKSSTPPPSFTPKIQLALGPNNLQPSTAHLIHPTKKQNAKFPLTTAAMLTSTRQRDLIKSLSLINAFLFYWEYLHNSPFPAGDAEERIRGREKRRSFVRVARRRRRRSTSPRIPGATTRSAVGSNLPLSGLRTAVLSLYVCVCVCEINALDPGERLNT